MQDMFNGASSFNQTVNFSSTANVALMESMFLNVPLFEQDLASWDTFFVFDCSDFCPRCGLPAFPLCGNPCTGHKIYTNERNMSVCYRPTSRPTAPSTPYPTTHAPHARSLLGCPSLAPSASRRWCPPQRSLLAFLGSSQ